MEISQMIENIGQKARQAARKLASVKPEVKNRALEYMAQLFTDQMDTIKAENKKDLVEGEQKGLSKAMLDRLLLNDKRIDDMIKAFHTVISLEDPVGEMYDVKVRPNGLKLGRMRCPIGVIGIIYESRPNVTADAGCLCLKSGNAVILRGGSEAFHSNIVLARLMTEACMKAGLPEGCIQLIPTTDRAAVDALLKASKWVDLIIPRGGTTLIEKVTSTSIIPVIKHYNGNCFIYADETIDIEESVRIIVNAKTQRPGVCNALETLLIQKDIAQNLLKNLAPVLLGKGVEIRGDEEVCRMVPQAVAAKDSDWEEEYLALILAIKVVESFEEAVEFINRHGSHHTDAILTKNHARAMEFLSSIDSACVFVNCSTRFSDGGEFGMGCEIGISTDKLHARGPMGLKELTTYKFIVLGDGQIRV
jgi:glutamate-5-semialdehyde dehydrogenase